MNAPNLFDRLEGYAQENFTTETLAYILQADRKVRSKFLKLLLREKPKMRAAFKECEIDTQFSYDIGRPDLKITARKNKSRIFVEVKTRAPGSEEQIRRYLKLGHVACLTPLRQPLSHKSDKYLGHFFWYEVYSIINSVTSKGEINQQFLTFLEARHMGPSKPITQPEVKAAVHAVAVIRKFQEVVSGVRDRIEDAWIKQFGKNAGEKSVSDGVGNESLPSWRYRTKQWKRKGSGSFYLWIGVEVERKHQQPQFFLGIMSSKKKFAHRVECDFESEFQKLTAQGWRKDPPEDDWCYAKFFPLGEGAIDKIAEKQAKNVKSATMELRKIIRLMESKI